MVRTGGAAAVLGMIFGFVENSLWGGIYMWLVLYAVGFGAGKVLHKIASHKLGKKVVGTMIGGLLIGAMLSPAGNVLLGRSPNLTAAVDAAQSLSASAGDPEFIANAAIKAKKHFPEFETAFETSKPGQHFSIKAPFEEGEEIEHLWLTVDGIVGETITGRIASEPELLDNVKEGDVRTVNVKDIDDFNYTDEEDVPHGNYSINRAAMKKVSATLAGYSNPYRTSSCWLNLLILAFGIISPVLAVKVRN